jgi:hypothetical protein
VDGQADVPQRLHRAEMLGDARHAQRDFQCDF